MYVHPPLRSFLARQGGLAFVVLAGITAFASYACVYALRKPFAAGQFVDLEWMGIPYKIALVIAQVLGYALSKFIGIRVIPTLSARHRFGFSLLLSFTALAALFGLAVSPVSWGVFWMFINGIPLGMAWGIIFSYLEGRKVTEALAALLCINFIVSSGFVKTIGLWLILHYGVTEFWMPFATGALFFPVLMVSIWLMEHLPQPTASDKIARNERLPMTAEDQRFLLREFNVGIITLVVIYLFFTIIRDMRDNFNVEIWSELHMGQQPAILTLTELPIAFVVLLVVGLGALIKNNFRALLMYHLIIIGCAVLLGWATLAFMSGWLSPIIWMISSGIFIILPYILFNGIIFDRMMAAFRLKGNVGFMIYIADAIGYLGSVAVMMYRNFGQHDRSWVDFFSTLCLVGAGFIFLGGLYSMYYFKKKGNHYQLEQTQPN